MSDSEDETTGFSEERVAEWLKDPKKKEPLIGIGESANAGGSGTGDPIDEGSNSGKESAGD